MPCRNPWKSQTDSIPAKTTKFFPPAQTNYTRPRFCKPWTVCTIPSDFVRFGVAVLVSVKCKGRFFGQCIGWEISNRWNRECCIYPLISRSSCSRYDHFRDLTKMIGYFDLTGFTWHHSPNEGRRTHVLRPFSPRCSGLIFPQKPRKFTVPFLYQTRKNLYRVI